MRSQLIAAVVLTCVGSEACAESTASISQGKMTPQFSKMQVEQALDRGLDLTKVDFRPGVHIVPLDRAWDTPDRIQVARREIAEQKKDGFYSVQPGEIVDVRSALKAATAQLPGPLAGIDRSFGSVDEVRHRLAVNPVGLGNSALASARLMEVRLAGGLVDRHWTGLARTFDVPGLGFVILDETDHVAGRQSLTLIEEWLNVEINGHRGTVKTARDAAGRSTVIVGWVNERKIYSLLLEPSDPEPHQANQERLVEIAKGLVES